MDKYIFDNLRKELKAIDEKCRDQGLEFRYFFSFYVFQPGEQNEAINNYTGAFGEKESVLKAMQGLKVNLEFEKGEFINV